MSGSESQRSFDFNTNAICPPDHLPAVVPAVNQEAACLDRLEIREAGGDPVLLLYSFKLRACGGVWPRSACDDAPDRRFVRRIGEIDVDQPSVRGLVFEGRDAGFLGIEQFP